MTCRFDWNRLTSQEHREESEEDMGLWAARELWTAQGVTTGECGRLPGAHEALQIRLRNVHFLYPTPMMLLWNILKVEKH